MKGKDGAMWIDMTRTESIDIAKAITGMADEKDWDVEDFLQAIALIQSYAYAYGHLIVTASVAQGVLEMGGNPNE